ncbi:LOW QUALITY PROTEIN: hypothetical protein NC652_024256 [Populus alba x Populus x berolinensis]|nr:LOW QUALITY PROTEIN: hypothetical protein NC652_024256 [Populus alba x Populus x berolinensis]
MDCKFPSPGTRISKYNRRQSLDKLDMIKLVDVMLERLRCLNEDELSSLATIVDYMRFKCCLGRKNSKVHDPVFAADYTSSQALNLPRRMSSVGSGTMRRNEVRLGLPSLDNTCQNLKERCKEAKDRRRNELKAGNQGNTDKTGDGNVNIDGKKTSSKSIPDLGSILMKHSSKLEKEIEEAKKHSRKSFEIISKKPVSDLTTSEGISDLEHSSKLEKEVLEIRKNSGKTFDMDGKDLGGAINGQRKDVPEVPSLDKFLVKHVSRLEKEVQEAKNRKKNESVEKGRLEKENVDLNKEENTLEGEKLQALSSGSNCGNYRHQNKYGGNVTAGCEGLDRVLVKRVSRLEKEKMASSLNQEEMNVKRSSRKVLTQTNEGSKERRWLLLSNLEKCQLGSLCLVEKQERESCKKHGEASAAWIKAEEEARRQATEEV